MYNAFTGESGMMSGIDNMKQLKKHCFTGEELKEFAEHCIKYASQQQEWIPESKEAVIDKYFSHLGEADKRVVIHLIKLPSPSKG